MGMGKHGYVYFERLAVERRMGERRHIELASGYQSKNQDS
jgi:hypothetical protein